MVVIGGELDRSVPKHVCLRFMIMLGVGVDFLQLVKFLCLRFTGIKFTVRFSMKFLKIGQFYLKFVIFLG